MAGPNDALSPSVGPHANGGTRPFVGPQSQRQRFDDGNGLGVVRVTHLWVYQDHLDTSKLRWRTEGVAVEQILVICTTDVCVAPAMALSLERALRTVGVCEVMVTSAGLRPGSARCAEQRGRHRVDLLDHNARTARPRLVTANLVTAADMVLTSQSRLRGVARALDLSSAAKTFSIMEAGELAKAVPWPASPSLHGQMCSVPVNWLVKEMDALRGTVAPPVRSAALRHWIPWRGGYEQAAWAAGFDLSDPHSEAGRHRDLHHRLDQSAGLVADALVMGLVASGTN